MLASVHSIHDLGLFLSTMQKQYFGDKWKTCEQTWDRLQGTKKLVLQQTQILGNTEIFSLPSPIVFEDE